MWAYEVVAGVWSSARFFGWPAPLDYVVIEHFAAKLIGPLLVLTGLGLYGISLRHLGTSWRLGIDRTAPGPLVTKGVYGFSAAGMHLR